MRKLIRLGAAIALAASGLVITAGPSAADPVDVIDCSPGQGVTTPPVSAGGIDVLGGNENCLQAYRSLVFVGVAEIDNGVNFNGVGGVSPGTHTAPDPADDPTGGGTYTYNGDCVMVHWESPAESTVPSGDPSVIDCTFGVVGGNYERPTNPQPVVSQVFSPISGEAGNHNAAAGEALDWAPHEGASCFSSSGEGIADFTSDAASILGSETWTSDYDWTNSLNNLRGSITGPAGTFDFDAKIEAHANPQASDGPIDQTDAGCLQKPLNDLTNPAANGPRTGLNSILISGTATWDSSVPTLFP